MCGVKINYNDEEVHYCANPICLSLNIKELSNSTLYLCGECGNTTVHQTHINTWIEMYNKEHGKYFLSKEDTD